ncbi:MAG: hypothetical protein N2166_04475 [candidate division WOR-3 bacterium]|nr:hypothetical protein [candidate division WOR-3 bacterium]
MCFKRFLLLWAAIIVSLAYAQINWDGYLLIDNRVRTSNLSYSFNELRWALNAQCQPVQELKFVSGIWIRSLGTKEFNTSRDLFENIKVAPLELNLKEAYFILSGFPIKNIDWSMGKQRISWGVATRFSPTDNINPIDLEDPWDFNRRLSVTSFKASYYHRYFSLTGVYVPLFTPAVLPKNTLFFSLSNLPLNFNYRKITDTLLLENKLKETQSIGVRIKSKVLNYDFSFSYLMGRYEIPYPKRIIFIPTQNPNELDLKTELYFPKRHIIGIDWMGTIKDLGVWAEVAMYLPEKAVLTYDLTLLGMGTADSIILDNTQYFRYVLGFDYTFTNNIYCNLEYFHGFVFEHGKDNLCDYLAFTLEYKFCDEKLKLYPINGIVEIYNRHSFLDNYGLVFMPEIGYYPLNDLEVILGLRFIEAKPNTRFEQFKDCDEVYLKVKYCF